MVWTIDELAHHVRAHEIDAFFKMYGLKDIEEVRSQHVADWLDLPVEELTFVDEAEGDGNIIVGFRDEGEYRRAIYGPAPTRSG